MLLTKIETQTTTLTLDASRKSIDKKAQNRLFHAVVWRFLGDDYIVDVAFTKAGRGDADESALFRELRDVARAHVAHAALQPADELIGETAQRTFICHASFDAFGDELSASAPSCE